MAHNIKVGVRATYSSKGFIGKLLDASNVSINEGLYKVKYDVIGANEEVNPREKFHTIFENAKPIETNKIVNTSASVVLSGDIIKTTQTTIIHTVTAEV